MAQKPLTDRQMAFCREYVIDFVGSAAAIRAGYAVRGADVTATRLLDDPRVQAEIKRLTARIAAKAEMQAEDIVRQLENIVRADIRDVVEWGNQTIVDEQGNQISIPFVKARQASADLPPEISCAIAEVSMTKDGTFKVKMRDPLAAVDKLMRYHGLYERDNKQKTDALADLIDAVQGSALPVASRSKPKAGEGDNE